MSSRSSVSSTSLKAYTPDEEVVSSIKEGTPWVRACFTVVATMAGAGVLNLPYALNQSGWSGLALLSFICYISCYCGKILIKSMESTAGYASTYQEIGRLAFGENGYRLTSAVQNVTLFLVSGLFLILAGSNTQSLFGQWISAPVSIKYCIIANAVLVWPANVGLRTMKEVSFIAVGGMMATFFAVIVICIYSIKDGKTSSDHSVFNAQSYPNAFSSFVFAFGGHNVFPAIQDTMREKHLFDRVMNVSFLVTWLVYIPPSVLGYLYFGSAVQSPVLLSIQTGVVAQIATIAITIHLWCTIPILNNPLFLFVEDFLKIDSGNYAFLKRFALRTIILVGEAVIATFVPHFPDVTSFIGASTICATVFFFPCFFYLKIHWANISKLELAWVFLILLIASLGSIIGIYGSLIQLVADLSGKPAFNADEWFFFAILGSVAYIAVVAIGMGMWGISNFYHYNDERYCM